MSRFQEAIEAIQVEAGPQTTASGTERCSFCRRPADQVGALMPGFDALICDVCVTHAYQITLPAMLPGRFPGAGTGAHGSAGSAPRSIREEVEHARGMLKMVDESVTEAGTGLRQLLENLKAYLATAGSDKLLVTLPWAELQALAASMDAFARAVEVGESESTDVSRSG